MRIAYLHAIRDCPEFSELCRSVEGAAEGICLQPPAEISSHTSHCKV